MNEAYVKAHPPKTERIRDEKAAEEWMKKANEYWALSNFHRRNGNTATADAFRCDAYEYERKAREEAWKEIKIEDPESKRRAAENNSLKAELSKINQYENQINALDNDIGRCQKRITEIDNELKILEF